VRSQHKYSRVERERRFLLNQFPVEAHVVRIRHIRDCYIDCTHLRLRQQIDNDGPSVFKLTQKVPSPGSGAQQGFITSMDLSEEEFRILAQLPARQLNKTRYSVPPFGIDVFEDPLEGLILAEAEFESASDADSLILPSFIAHEVSADVRFTGGYLAHAPRQEIQALLSEYGIKFF
jgi:CYTH domain-containing protein